MLIMRFIEKGTVIMNSQRRFVAEENIPERGDRVELAFVDRVHGRAKGVYQVTRRHTYHEGENTIVELTVERVPTPC